jgi:MraZ protein
MFRGESSIVIDDKGRLAIPKGYRELLMERWGEPMRLTLTIGLTPDIEQHRWLVAYPAPEWEAYETRLNEVSPFDWEARKVAGMLIGHANDVELDRQGRLVIPPSLRTFAKLGSKATIVGQGREFELWDEEKRDMWREDSIASVGRILANPSPGLLAISR